MADKDLTRADKDFEDFSLEDARAIYEAQVATQDRITEGIQTLQSLMEDCRRPRERLMNSPPCGALCRIRIRVHFPRIT